MSQEASSKNAVGSPKPTARKRRMTSQGGNQASKTASNHFSPYRGENEHRGSAKAASKVGGGPGGGIGPRSPAKIRIAAAVKN